jgi:hypothetical protein
VATSTDFLGTLQAAWAALPIGVGLTDFASASSTSQVAEYLVGSFPSGGCFRLTYNNGAVPWDRRWYIGELQGVTAAPLAYLSRACLPGGSYQTTSPTGTPPSIVIAVSGMLALWMSMAAQLAGASVGLVVTGGISRTGGTRPAVAAGVAYAANASDAVCMFATGTNGGAWLNSLSNNNVIQGMPSPPAIVIPPTQAPAPAALLPDLDIGVNNGSSLWCVTSNTIVEP